MRQDEWTTERGETRRRYVVECDELAASIRFNAVAVHRATGSDEPGSREED
jgi:hypothetical protein